MKKYTIDVNECSPPPIKREEPTNKSDSFSFSILFLAVLATFILFPESVDTVNEYYNQQREYHYPIQLK